MDIEDEKSQDSGHCHRDCSFLIVFLEWEFVKEPLKEHGAGRAGSSICGPQGVVKTILFASHPSGISSREPSARGVYSTTSLGL
jgi:hypothetical protein